MTQAFVCHSFLAELLVLAKLKVSVPAGFTFKHQLPQAGHVAPALQLISENDSGAGVPSRSDRIQAVTTTSQHALQFHAPVVLSDQDGQGHYAQTPRAGSLTDPAQSKQSASTHRPYSLAMQLSSTYPKKIAASDTAVEATNRTRGQSIINHSSLYASPKMLSSPAAVQLADKSASINRRASLAAKLQRMAENADSRNDRACDNGSQPPHAEHNGYANKAVGSTPFSPESGVPYSATLPPKIRPSFDVARTTDSETASGQSAQQASTAVDSKAASVRRQHLQIATDPPEHFPMPASTFTTESPNAIDNVSIDNHHDGQQASHAGQTPALKRTLSNAALEALDAVQSMQCPIIPYQQLQMHRKIGDGSIGQVCSSCRGLI